MQAKTQLELKMLDMSARSLGEADEETETDEAKLKEKREKQARWEARGAEIKEEIRESLLFSFMPDYMRAAYVTLHGWPGKGKEEAVTPLEGVSPQIARSLLTLIQKETFSRGVWAKNALWRQLEQGGRLARKRLETTAQD
jgi:hypothetical protein